MSARTPGEAHFEYYLASVGLQAEYERDFPGRSKKPDYAIQAADGLVLADVKDFDQTVHLGYGAFDSTGDIRVKIKRAASQFKEFRDFPCVLVLHVASGPVMIHEPWALMGAMYGRVHFRLPLSPGGWGAAGSGVRLGFADDGRMYTKDGRPQNTTISAIASIRVVPVGVKKFVHEYMPQFPKETLKDLFHADPGFDVSEKAIGLVVAENHLARKPVPPDIFTGPFDERWVWSADGVTRSFAGPGAIWLQDIEDKKGGAERS